MPGFPISISLRGTPALESCDHKITEFPSCVCSLMPLSRSSYDENFTPPFPPNPALQRSQPQWLFTPSELQRAPSIHDGMSTFQERSNRIKGVTFITQVGILLKLPQLTLATASVYLHRFFMRHSMVDLPNRPGMHHYTVAATALFLATKVEENCRKIRELVVACCRVAQKQPNLVVDEQNKEYWKWRDTILHNEDVLLEALCFDLEFEQPYRILFNFLCYYGVQDNKQLRNAAWAFTNDSHVTVMCLLYTPRAIAGAALYFAAKSSGDVFPDDDSGHPWWEHLGLCFSEVQGACNLMADEYEKSPLPKKSTYAKDEEYEPYGKTRQIFSPIHGFSPTGIFGAESQGVRRGRDGSNIGNGESSTISPDRSQRPQLVQSQAHHPERVSTPKRQRRESSTSSMPGQPSHLPIAHELPEVHEDRHAVNITNVDDVQQRIDAIINASNPDSARRNAYPPPPSSKQMSNQQRSAPLLRRRSSSISNRHRPVSRQDSYVNNRRPPSRQDDSYSDDWRSRRPSHDPGLEDRQGSLEREERPLHNGVRQDDDLGSRLHQELTQGDEKIGSGSEEGEL